MVFDKRLLLSVFVIRDIRKLKWYQKFWFRIDSAKEIETNEKRNNGVKKILNLNQKDYEKQLKSFVKLCDSWKHYDCLKL